jgi:aconitate hydratase
MASFPPIRFTITGIADTLAPQKVLTVKAEGEGGAVKEFKAVCRIDTPNELDYYRHGGILQFVLRQLAKA